jgi:hypothetical protein
MPYGPNNIIIDINIISYFLHFVYILGIYIIYLILFYSKWIYIYFLRKSTLLGVTPPRHAVIICNIISEFVHMYILKSVHIYE